MGRSSGRAYGRNFESLEGRRLMAAGQFDPSFGTAGGTDVSAPTGPLTFAAVAQTPDGKVLAVGRTGSNLVLVRLTATGQPDETFAPGGRLVTALADEFAAAAAVNPTSGKIALAYVAANNSLHVAVLNATGAPDATFDSDGVRVFNFAGNTGLRIAWQDAKLIVGGSGAATAGSLDDAVFITRLNANGSTDTVFGTSGVATIDDGLNAADTRADERQLGSLDVAADGKVVVGSHLEKPVTVNNQADFEHAVNVTRLTSDGDPDAAFGTQGLTTLFTQQGVNDAQLRDVAAKADGSLHALWFSQPDINQPATYNVSSLQSNGTPGGGYNGAIAFADVSYSPASIAAANDGKFLVRGDVVNAAGPFGQIGNHFVARFYADGKADLSYGNRGAFLPPQGYFERDGTPVAMHAKPDGSVLLGGTRLNNAVRTLRVVQLQGGAGTPATVTLNKKGTLIVHTDNIAEQVSAYIRGRDGRLVVRVNDFAQSFAPSKVKRMAFWTYGGADTFTVGNGVTRAAYCDGGDENDTLNGGVAGDVFLGGAGNDQLFGFDGDDILVGNVGNDYCLGGAGKDDLFGDAGRDTLSGAGGNDRHFGGTGVDRVRGGNGTDSAAQDAQDLFESIEAFI